MHIKSATDVVGIFWNNIQCLDFISGEGGGEELAALKATQLQNCFGIHQNLV